MNNIGSIELKNEVKILDAFDFPEEFSVINLNHVKAGKWLAFNDVKNETMADMNTNVVKDFFYS